MSGLVGGQVCLVPREDEAGAPRADGRYQGSGRRAGDLALLADAVSERIERLKEDLMLSAAVVTPGQAQAVGVPLQIGARSNVPAWW